VRRTSRGEGVSSRVARRAAGWVLGAGFGIEGDAAVDAATVEFVAGGVVTAATVEFGAGGVVTAAHVEVTGLALVQ